MRRLTHLETCRAAVAETQQAYQAALTRKDRRAEHHTWIAYRDARVSEMLAERAETVRRQPTLLDRLAACFREQQPSAGIGSR